MWRVSAPVAGTVAELVYWRLTGGHVPAWVLDVARGTELAELIAGCRRGCVIWLRPTTILTSLTCPILSPARNPVLPITPIWPAWRNGVPRVRRMAHEQGHDEG